MEMTPCPHTDAERAAAGCPVCLRAERDAALEQLSSGLCSAHQTPDPLRCDMCNMVKMLTAANMHFASERDGLRTNNAKLRSALIAFVGESNPDEIRKMAAMLDHLPVPDDERPKLQAALEALASTP